MRSFLTLFQTTAGAWHLPSILMMSSWLIGSLVTGAFMFANLKVNRDDRRRAYDKEQQSIAEANKARSRIEELETWRQPRTISPTQRALFIEATKAGPLGPVVLATHSALPTKEEEDFTMQLRSMLDEAGFGTSGSNIVNGFSTGSDPKQFLAFVSRSDRPPPYFSNLAGGLYKIGLVSPDVPISVNNPRVKDGTLYLFVAEK